MKKLVLILFLPLLFNSCCLEDTSNQVGTKIVFSIQVQDTIWGWTSNSQIQSIEWLGSNFIDTIYSDTAWNLRLNLNSDQTSFKVNNSILVISEL